MTWSNQRVLMIAPHPDDEVIGCGGLISRVKRAGGEVYVLFMTVGETADVSDAGRSTAAERLLEVEQVADFLGFDGHHVAFPGDQYHLRLDAVPRLRLVSMIERDSVVSIAALEPTVVLLPHGSSYNQDHRRTAQAAITALRPTDATVRHQPDLVLAYEQVADGWTTDPLPPPAVFVELTDADLEQKIKALSLYASQHREHPSSRSGAALRSLAVVRGAQAGMPLAEAFHCLRMRT